MVIRKKRLTERGGIDWILFYYRVVRRGRPQEDKLLSYGVWAGKGIWVERRKGKADQLSFRRTACFINNPLFGPQTQSGNFRVSPGIEISCTASPALPHYSISGNSYYKLARFFLIAPPIPVLPHTPITRGINFLFSISEHLRRCRHLKKEDIHNLPE